MEPIPQAQLAAAVQPDSPEQPATARRPVQVRATFVRVARAARRDRPVTSIDRGLNVLASPEA